MTLYFNGGTEDQVLSAGTVLLFHLPVDGAAFDPVHRDIATLAQRLGNEVALVPLSQIWPVADPSSRRWIRLMGCPMASTLGVREKTPVLFTSIGHIQGRACVVARAEGVNIAQLVEALLMHEEQGCPVGPARHDRVFDWVWQAQREQENAKTLSDFSAIQEALTGAFAGACHRVN